MKIISLTSGNMLATLSSYLCPFSPIEGDALDLGTLTESNAGDVLLTPNATTVVGLGGPDWNWLAQELSKRTELEFREVKDTASLYFVATQVLDEQLRRYENKYRWSRSYIVRIALYVCRPLLDLTLSERVRRAVEIAERKGYPVVQTNEMTEEQRSTALSILLSTRSDTKTRTEFICRSHVLVPRTIKKLIDRVAAQHSISRTDAVVKVLTLCLSPTIEQPPGGNVVRN